MRGPLLTNYTSKWIAFRVADQPPTIVPRGESARLLVKRAVRDSYHGVVPTVEICHNSRCQYRESRVMHSLFMLQRDRPPMSAIVPTTGGDRRHWPLVSTALVRAVRDRHEFSSRHLAVWLGLVPRQQGRNCSSRGQGVACELVLSLATRMRKEPMDHESRGA
jgi:hypothetical protein